MARITEVRISNTTDERYASLKFSPGPNVVTGDSDTGKSYLLHLIDFVLGAEELSKVIDEAAGYDTAWLEFLNAAGETLTLMRNLEGGGVRAYNLPIREINRVETAGFEDLVHKRQGGSKAADITSKLFPFLGMPPDVTLRRNADGGIQRLSIRVLLSAIIIDEESIITTKAPIAPRGFGQTAYRRMLSYLLTGEDDSEVVAYDNHKAETAESVAKCSIIDDLLSPLRTRLENHDEAEDKLRLQNITNAIEKLSDELADDHEKRKDLRKSRQRLEQHRLKAKTQLQGIDGMLKRYELLIDRYSSDLQRLDFVSEGSHFYDSLQESTCPLCEQPLDGSVHIHNGVKSDGMFDSKLVYDATRTEAAKIRGLQDNLRLTIQDVELRRTTWIETLSIVELNLEKIDKRMDMLLESARSEVEERLDQLVERRLQIQSTLRDRYEYRHLSELKTSLIDRIEKAQTKPEWAAINSIAVTNFCREIEKVLVEWSWGNDVRVEFEDSKHGYDIKVDGKPRRSHGKGFRAVLHSAFSIGLLRYCVANDKPHPGFVILDSPLTTVKQRKGGVETTSEEDLIDPRIEPNFWKSLSKVSNKIQVIVIENKEPPKTLFEALNAQLFAGSDAQKTERIGFIDR